MTKTQFNQARKQDSKFENINIDNFSAGSHGTESGVVLATRKTEGHITLSFSSMHWMFDGALKTLAQGIEYGKNIQETITIIGHSALHQRVVDGVVQDKFTMYLQRHNVESLRCLLEARIAHCEHERDQRNELFNPDTYIAMKFLLLDLREWLMIEAIGNFEPQKEPQEDTYSPNGDGIMVTGAIEEWNGLDYWVIDNSQYQELKNPQFMGQTIADKDGKYVMFWLSNGSRYATRNTL